jgi:hypothetical protein
MEAEYKAAIERAKKAYLEMLTELVERYEAKNAITAKETQEGLDKLAEIQSKVDSAVKANKRAELDRQQKDFYRLQVPDIDIEEIKMIRSIEPYLRNKEPLNKVIWKSYYEKPYTDLVGRVIG